MKILSILVVLLALIILSLVALTCGVLEVSFGEILRILAFDLGLTSESPSQESIHIINALRLPRVLGAIIVGALLALCGCVYQGVFTNPLVSPGILGVLAGASFGAALGMVLRLPYAFIEILSFAFAFLSVGFAVALAFIFAKSNKILMLILGGIISSSLFSGLVSIIKYLADPYEALPNIVFWLMGSLANVREDSLAFAFVVLVVCALAAILGAKHLDILCLGEDEAKSLGVNVRTTRIAFIFIATLAAATSVMIAGIVGWIGLVVPHIGRFVVGANHRYLLCFSILFGALFLLLIDTVNRAFFSVEVPIGILTSVIGVVIFGGILAAYRNKL